MSRNFQNRAEFESPSHDIIMGMETVSSCCAYTIVHLDVNKEDKMFCLNCGRPCGAKIIRSKTKQNV